MKQSSLEKKVARCAKSKEINETCLYITRPDKEIQRINCEHLGEKANTLCYKDGHRGIRLIFYCKKNKGNKPLPDRHNYDFI